MGMPSFAVEARALLTTLETSLRLVCEDLARIEKNPEVRLPRLTLVPFAPECQMIFEDSIWRSFSSSSVIVT